MKTVNLNTITTSTSTNQDGDLLFDFLSSNAINNKVLLQIDPGLNLSSSFLNSSFGKFIDFFGFEIFKNNLTFQTNKTSFDIIKNYVENVFDVCK